MKLATGCIVALLVTGCSQPAPKSAVEARDADHDRAVEELADATQVLDEMNQIPSRHRERARCVVVVPSLVRAGFVVGARHGDGVASCRAKNGWSGPVFVSITGGSAGLQVGFESSDLVMLVMSDRGMTKLFRTSFALGADASAAAGPVGQAAQAGTDASITAEILTYARSRGLFAGAELSGAVVKQDGDAIKAVYGTAADVHDILAGDVAAPKEAGSFLARLGAAFPEVGVAEPMR
jgi:lipid-binding SYLF domain-containing protein